MLSGSNFGAATLSGLLTRHSRFECFAFDAFRVAEYCA
jgi:hypothetical protein